MRVEILLRKQHLPTVCLRLGLTLERDGSAAGGGPALDRHNLEAVSYARAVLKVAALWPTDSCLRRCLVLGHLMRSRCPTLVLGVRRDDAGRIAAHSWLQFEQFVLDPGLNEDEYLAF